MSELQGILLCAGSGNRMPELTDYNSKCLLPVAGYPMFWYPLNSISRTGVRDVKLVVKADYKDAYCAVLQDPVFQWNHMKIEVITLPADQEDWGTADTLRFLRKSIKLDLLIVSGDFVSDMSLAPMIERFRCQEASACMLFSEHCVSIAAPGPKAKKPKERDFLAYCERDNKIAFCLTEEDFDKPIIADSWVESHKEVQLTARYRDCHVYLLRNTVLDVLDRETTMSSLKVDLLPWIMEVQRETDGNAKNPWSCVGYFQPLENGTVTAHSNNLGAYFAVNQKMIKALPRLSARLSAGQEFNFKATGISCQDSRVGGTSVVAGGAVLRRSSIGENVSIGEKAVIEGSVIMDGVEIGKGARVSMSILAPGVKVKEGAHVTNCIVANEQIIEKSQNIQNEIIAADDNDDWHKAS
ncbi:unnamed protein product, partial [Mesorhabditis spiculigera]